MSSRSAKIPDSYQAPGGGGDRLIAFSLWLDVRSEAFRDVDPEIVVQEHFRLLNPCKGFQVDVVVPSLQGGGLRRSPSISD